MDPASRISLTEDGFLGESLSVLQPSKGYRAATDPVFLAASVPARPGETVLELGCGVGVALLCLARRVPDLSLTGVEIQPDYALLAKRNARRNVVPMHILTGDIADLPAALRAISFHHVILNPPYLRAGCGTTARDAGKERAFREATPLAMWIGTAIRRLRPKGWLSVIQRADRLPELLQLLGATMGSIEVKPLSARQDRTAGRVILRAQKGGRADFRLHAPLILHKGATHSSDSDGFTEIVDAILRQGAPLRF